MQKRDKKTRKKRIIITIILILAFLLIIFGAKAYLYLRVLIGNDLIVKLSADKENLVLKHGESGNIKITSIAIANIFCETRCSSRFIDLSTNSIFRENSFNLKLPKTQEYNLTAPETGTGMNLYRFDLECYSPRSILCETDGEVKKNSLLVTLNYEPTAEEKMFSQQLDEKLSNFLEKINYYSDNLDEFDIALKKLNKNTPTEELKKDFLKNKELLSNINHSSENLVYYWSQEDYSRLNDEIIKFNESLSSFESGFQYLNNSINSYLFSYNILIDNMINIRDNLESLKQQNLTDNSTDELNKMIREFNNLTIMFSENNSILNKTDPILELLNKTLVFSPESSDSVKPTVNLTIFNQTRISLNNTFFSRYVLVQHPEKCCFKDICGECCNDACYNQETKYPIIFLHGHSFNEKVSADVSIEIFEDIQRGLESDNYLNAGTLFLSSSKNSSEGVWSKINLPLTIKASYYFDILTNEGKNAIIQTKTDNLDTYTLRLRDIVNEIKSKTNRKKVIIMAHSMGGLIARRYIQVFGEEDIDKLIMIDSPNHGITGKTSNLCPVLGTKLECSDMDKDSLFMSKLNNAQKPNIPIYNIIGVGCDTDGEDGDGVVTNSSQYLDYSDNYYLNGSCTEFEYLHTKILDIEKYPETLILLKDILNNSSNIANFSS